MPLSKIKLEHQGTFVGFKGSKSALPLGSNPDIDELAIIAQRSGDPLLKSFFEVLPPLDQLLKDSVESQLTDFRKQTPKPNETKETEQSAHTSSITGKGGNSGPDKQEGK